MSRSLELYVHIPFCVKKCSYCDFLSFAVDEQTQLSYADALIKEIKAYAPKMKEYEVSTIYIGGGTPSWLDENKMVEIMSTIFACFHVNPKAEISMECNPGTVTLSKLEKYHRVGINRLSIGLQSADNEELRILGRIHTYEQFIRTYELARSAGFSNINIDLMSGIPYQTSEKFLHTLQKVVRLKPNHISAYSLIVEPGTPFYEAYASDLMKQETGYEPEVLPTEDEVYRMIKRTQKYLAEAGYEQYEISNFALPGFECQHNIGYWTRENYLGLGLGAASLIENVRYSNTTDLYDYMKNASAIEWKTQEPFPQHSEQSGDSIQQESSMNLQNNLHEVVDVVSRKAQMEEYMFLGLRMKKGVTREAFEQNFGIAIEAIYKEPLDRMKKEGLMQMQAGQIVLTEKGEDLSNYVLAQFLL